MKLLLDTNVLVDYLGRKEPFFASASRVIAAGYFHDAELFAPSQSFIDAFYVLKRYVNPLSLQRAIEALFDVVSPVAATENDVRRAIDLQWDDLKDCLAAVLAVKINARYLITRDAAGFQRSMTPTLSPDEWLATMEQHGIRLAIVSSMELDN